MQLKQFEHYISAHIIKIKNNIKKGGHLFLVGAFIFMSVLAILLFKEYCFFSQQSNQLVLLKEQYKTYVTVLQEAICKYGVLPDQLDDDLDSCDNLLFPAGARVISSEDQNNNYVFINRDDEYLKQSSLEYLKEQQLDAAIKRIRGEEWFEYPDAFMQPTIASRKNKNEPRKVTTFTSKTKKRIHDMVFAWPIPRTRFWLSSLFGPRKKPNGSWGFHRGIDMAALSGTPVKAAAPGKIIEARYTHGYGNTVVVMHNNKYKTRYAHLKSITVKVGQSIMRGTLVGQVGDTGLVRKSGKDASHLHFEVYAYGKQINPLYCLG